MNKTNVIKGLVLINFVGLLTLFLFFRTGSFDNYFNNGKNLTSPNGGVPTKITEDTLVRKKDGLPQQRLSSSKSIVITDNLKFDKDSSKTVKDSSAAKLTDKERLLLYSSKTAILFDPKMFKPDSAEIKKQNSTKKKNK